MTPNTVTLGELEKLFHSLEEGGASGLSVADLAFLGRMLELVQERAGVVKRMVDSEVLVRLNAREADVVAENGSSITRTWKNEYNPNIPALVNGMLKLDADMVGLCFEFVPAESRVVTTEAHWAIKGNITRVKNWIEKLGLSGERQALTDALGGRKVSPQLKYKAVNPETGELL